MRALSLLLSSSALALTAAAPISFVADLAGERTSQTFPILDCVGSGHAALTLRADWRQHLAQYRADTGVRKVRFHGIFDDDMSTFLPSVNGQGGANMFNVFSTFDFLLSIGMRPIVEMSFMPQALSSNVSNTVFHYEGGISPPSDWQAYSAFVTGFVQALVDRYGLAEVSQWLFEVWNEPDCGFYYENGCCGPDCGNQAEYYKLYNVTSAAVKSVSPALQVGGPATAQLLWIGDFLTNMTSHKVPVDAVTSHLYPTDPEISQTDRDAFFKAINASAAVAESFGKPLVMTEMNSGLGIFNGTGQDDHYTAAFIVHNHLAFQDATNVPTLSFWTFTDIFEEQGFDSTPFNGKFGLQTIHQVPKSGYRGMQFLKAMQDTSAVPISASGGRSAPIYRRTSATVDTVDTSVMIEGNSRVVAVATNMNLPGMPIAAQGVTISFKNLPGTPPASVPVKVIDATHANPLPVWIAQGKPLYPTQQQIAEQLAASQFAPELVPLVPDGQGGYTLTLTLQPQGSALVEFTLQ